MARSVKGSACADARCIRGPARLRRVTIGPVAVATRRFPVRGVPSSLMSIGSIGMARIGGDGMAVELYPSR